MALYELSKVAAIIWSILLLLTISGCERSTSETSAPVETIVASTVHAPQDGVEAPFVPETSQARRFHQFTRRVRHHHAGPR
jgi:hypothetical protein